MRSRSVTMVIGTSEETCSDDVEQAGEPTGRADLVGEHVVGEDSRVQQPVRPVEQWPGPAHGRLRRLLG